MESVNQDTFYLFGRFRLVCSVVPLFCSVPPSFSNSGNRQHLLNPCRCENREQLRVFILTDSPRSTHRKDAPFSGKGAASGSGASTGTRLIVTIKTYHTFGVLSFEVSTDLPCGLGRNWNSQRTDVIVLNLSIARKKTHFTSGFGHC